MNMTGLRARANAFLRDETGAVTVDWVVLTAGVAFLSLAIIAVLAPATERLATRIQVQLDAVASGPGSN